MSEPTTTTGSELAPASSGGNLRRYFATSPNRIPRAVRWCRKKFWQLSIPAPAVIVKPLASLLVALRTLYYALLRIFICEPFLKAHCKKYGTNVHTGCYLHWILGKGDIVLGDNVVLDGKIAIGFAARFSDRPVLEIGDNSGIGHNCRLVVGKRITIGKRTVISGDCIIMDSNGHQVDPAARVLGKPPEQEEVRPVTIGNDVWIGMNSIIFPGVRIGDGSVVSAGSIVRTHVPPYSVVAGNPARVMFRLKKPESSGPTA